MDLRIHKETATRVPKTRMQRLLALIKAEEGKPSWRSTVNLVFTTDTRMRRLNREFRGVSRTTDVLSFNIDDPAESGGVFGEVYISVPTAARQARQRGLTLSQEYLRLVCHGLLHLFGYDHDVHETSTMKRREDHFLERLRGMRS